MTRVVLRKDLRNRIISDVKLQAEIASASLKSIQTVKRWATNNSEMLLLETVTNAIRSTLKIPKSESLTETIEVKFKPKVVA